VRKSHFKSAAVEKAARMLAKKGGGKLSWRDGQGGVTRKNYWKGI